MARVIWGLTLSLDGFVNDSGGSVDALYPDLDAPQDAEPLREAIPT